MTQSKRKPVDWRGIERDFRSGTMSNREIAAWYGVSEGAVRKRAKAGAWVRSGTQDAPCVPVADLVAPHVPADAPEDASTIVEQGRGLAERLLCELETVVGHRGELEDLIVAHTATDRDGGRRRSAMLRSIALPSNAGVLKTIATALKTLGEVKHGATQDSTVDGADDVSGAAKADDDPMSAFLQ